MLTQPEHMVLLTTVAAALASGILINRRFQRQQRLLNVLRQELLAARSCLEALPPAASRPAANRFDTSLDLARLKNNRAAQTTPGPVPDRYRHAASLAAHGMAAPEMATFLNMTEREAEQLLKLARVAGPQPRKR